MMRIQILGSGVIIFAFTFAAAASSIRLCPEAGKRYRCIHDGDTWWDGGVKYRHEAIDTPEIGSGAACPKELELGVRARDRLQELMANGFETVPSGRKGRYGRELATIRLADGREAGAVLVSEGLAEWYGAEGRDWCVQ